MNPYYYLSPEFLRQLYSQNYQMMNQAGMQQPQQMDPRIAMAQEMTQQQQMPINRPQMLGLAESQNAMATMDQQDKALQQAIAGYMKSNKDKPEGVDLDGRKKKKTLWDFIG